MRATEVLKLSIVLAHTRLSGSLFQSELVLTKNDSLYWSDLIDFKNDCINVHCVNKVKDVCSTSTLRILDFNCKNILICGPLFKELERKIDIFLLQEHWLYDCQLNILQELHNDFTGTGKAVDSNDPIQPSHMPRGYGGVAILWKKNLDKLVTTLPIGNDRIQCIELSGNQKLLFISIYLPCKSSDNHLNKLYECIDQLHEIMEVYKATHQIIIGGDFNDNKFLMKITLIEKDIYLTLSEIHVKAINLFGNISRAKCDSIEWRLAERQLQIKPHNSHSWFIEIKEICLKYGITDLYDYLNSPLSKLQWKKLVKSKIYAYWTSKIIDKSKGYSTLKFMDHKYNTGTVHPLAISVRANLKDIRKIPVRLKIATGNYILQTHKASFSKRHISSICKLCSKTNETVEHFILLCEKLEETKKPLMSKILNNGSLILAKYTTSRLADLLQLIINPFCYVDFDVNRTAFEETSNILEPLCRQLLYNLNNKRYMLY
ncbi:unnamed protein product [Mytilus coruscus]|uniref:Endonuclease/exonuclease/phosphatase domain-containing protein n=1 Tax=Mytilus coruscus TaxID=42192 RepID=A0A6J8EVS6_MYTCO|nr:unnamed protein product [Mytilus coruscus]